MPSFKMKFSGVTILQGVEFSIVPIDFEWALQQCSATALPVIEQSRGECPRGELSVENCPFPRRMAPQEIVGILSVPQEDR